jgi:hypothetical protein
LVAASDNADSYEGADTPGKELGDGIIIGPKWDGTKEGATRKEREVSVLILDQGTNKHILIAKGLRSNDEVVCFEDNNGITSSGELNNANECG